MCCRWRKSVQFAGFLDLVFVAVCRSRYKAPLTIARDLELVKGCRGITLIGTQHDSSVPVDFRTAFRCHRIHTYVDVVRKRQFRRYPTRHVWLGDIERQDAAFDCELTARRAG